MAGGRTFRHMYLQIRTTDGESMHILQLVPKMEYKWQRIALLAITSAKYG
jgi:hypothetical protein